MRRVKLEQMRETLYLSHLLTFDATQNHPVVLSSRGSRGWNVLRTCPLAKGSFDDLTIIPLSDYTTHKIEQ